MSKAPSMCCPHCKSTASVRTSTQLSPLYREATYVCRNSHCGHVFVVGLEAVRTLSPSAMPDPDVDIPLSRHIRHREMVQQLQLSMEEHDATDPA